MIDNIAAQYLCTHPEATADKIAQAIGVEIEEAYAQLVQAEARGLVRINVYDHTRRTWESM